MWSRGDSVKLYESLEREREKKRRREGEGERVDTRDERSYLPLVCVINKAFISSPITLFSFVFS